jgi:hypothetical protein
MTSDVSSEEKQKRKSTIDPSLRLGGDPSAGKTIV